MASQPVPTQPVGPATQFGIVGTIVGGVGALIAGIDGNDTATITGGVTSVLLALGTLGGRYAQAVATIRHAADEIEPIVDAVFDALDDDEADAVADDDLPTDEEEFGALPDDDDELAAT